MSYPADPGGNFASDVHRRVMCAVANPDQDPTDLDEVINRVAADEHCNVEAGEVSEVLADLEADGDVRSKGGGWQNTKSGFEVLSGPIAADGGRKHD